MSKAYGPTTVIMMKVVRTVRLLASTTLGIVLLSLILTLPLVWTTTMMVGEIRTSGKWLMAGHVIEINHPTGIRNDGRSYKSVMSTKMPMNSSSFPSWLVAYIEFHQRHVEKDPLSGQPILKQGTPYLLWTCGKPRCGGLGDRLNGIVQAFYMAMCLDRVLLIQWEQPTSSRPKTVHQLVDFLLPNHIAWHASPKSHGSYANATSRRDWMMRTTDSSTTVLRTMNDNLAPVLLEPLLLRDKRDILGIEMHNNQWVDDRDSLCMQEYWSRFPDSKDTIRDHLWWYDELFRLAFDTLFQWNPQVLAVAKQIKQQANMNHPDAYVGLHVRVGGSNVNWVDPVRHPDPNQWLLFHLCGERVQKALATKCSAPTREMYLSSDSVRAKKYLLQHDTLQSFNQSWSTGSVRALPDLDIVHIDRSRNMQPNAYYNVWSEFLILSESICLVMSRSGFSELAARVMASAAASNPHSPGALYRKRCALYFNQCSEEQVKDAIQDVSCS